MPLARLVTALQPHFAEPMTTHEFIDEDVDLAVKIYLTGKSRFFSSEIGDKTDENNGNESDKENEEEKEETGRNRGRNNFG